MRTKDTDSNVVLQTNAPGEEGRVHAVLAGWGLEENSIHRLLTEGHTGATALRKVGGKQPDETARLLHGGTPRRGGYASH
ncbi:MAG: hypothetical protein QOF61_1558 [Acidobacteriota bacterium]|jgi:hypothetical protein|nr:hypothetical protein [Acidobacteriota bacterium]